MKLTFEQKLFTLLILIASSFINFSLAVKYLKIGNQHNNMDYKYPEGFSTEWDCDSPEEQKSKILKKNIFVDFSAKPKLYCSDNTLLELDTFVSRDALNNCMIGNQKILHLYIETYYKQYEKVCYAVRDKVIDLLKNH
ncbi:MAG: hypothetical protein MH321_00010 [Leptospiraceae bacterium]|nr:hypothetical protein [Leptospiraceae bacterium]